MLLLKPTHILSCIFTFTEFKILKNFLKLDTPHVIRSALFNLYYILFLFFRYFSVINFKFDSLWSKNIPWMVTILLNLLSWVLWPRMWSILVNVPVSLSRMCILLWSDGAICESQLQHADWWCGTNQLYCYCSSHCWNHWWCVEVCNCNSGFVYFFVQFHQLLYCLCFWHCYHMHAHWRLLHHLGELTP